MPRIASDMIQFDGINKLSTRQKAVLNKLSTEYFLKIKRMVGNLTALRVKIKSYEKEGARSKYSIDVNVTLPNKNTFNSNKASDWDFARALHKAFKDVMVHIKDKLHVTSGRKWSKPYE